MGIAVVVLLTLLIVPQNPVAAQSSTAGYHYHYDPSLTLTGSNYEDAPSESSLQLKHFSVAA
jgi:hypothetical protein